MSLTLFALYLLIGAFAGTMSGLLGIGGGLVVVPALALIFRYLGFPSVMLMQLAAGSSLAAMIVTTSASLRAHLSRQLEVWPIFRRFLPGILLGTVLGASLADLLHANIIKIVFGLFVLVISFRMLLLVESKPHRKLPGFLGESSVGFVIGLKSGFLGVGGGALTVPFLTYCNVPMRKTVAISLACGCVIAFVGTISFIIFGSNEPSLPAWSSGYVYWPAVLGVAMTSPIFAVLGTRLSHSLSIPLLKRLFGVFLLAMAFHLLIF